VEILQDFLDNFEKRFHFGLEILRQRILFTLFTKTFVKLA
jgi:hypothetical protein